MTLNLFHSELEDINQCNRHILKISDCTRSKWQSQIGPGPTKFPVRITNTDGPESWRRKIENLGPSRTGWSPYVSVHESLFEIGYSRFQYLSAVRVDRKSFGDLIFGRFHLQYKNISDFHQRVFFMGFQLTQCNWRHGGQNILIINSSDLRCFVKTILVLLAWYSFCKARNYSRWWRHYGFAWGIRLFYFSRRQGFWFYP